MIISSQIGIIRSRQKNVSEINSSGINFSTGRGDIEADFDSNFTILPCVYPLINRSEYTTSIKLGAAYYNAVSQTFTPSSYLFDNVTFYLNFGGTPTGLINISIHKMSGTYGVSGIPSLLIFNTGPTSISSFVPFDYSPQPVVAANFSFFYGLFEAGVSYTISIEYLDDVDTNNYIEVFMSERNDVSQGNIATLSGSTWTADTSKTLSLIICGFPYSYTTIKYDFANVDSYRILGISNRKNLGFTWTGNGSRVEHVSLYIKKLYGSTLNEIGEIQVSIFALSGGFPTGTALATTYTWSIFSMPDQFNAINFQFITPFLSTNGTSYGFVLEYTGGTVTTDVQLAIGVDQSSASYTGTMFYQNVASSTYLNEVSTTDMCFNLFTVPIVETAFETYDASINGDQFNYIAATQNTKMAQSFTGIDGAFSKVSVNLRATGSPTGNITASLFADDGGTFGTTSKPTGTALATSTTISASTISGTETQYTFTFSTPYTMTAGTIYWIAIEYSSGSSSNKIGVVVDISSPTAPGRCAYYNGTTWAFTTYDSVGTSGASDDLCYVMYALQ